MFFYPPRLAVIVVGAFSAVPYIPLPPPAGVWVVFRVLALRPSRGCLWRHVVSRGRLSFWCCVLVGGNRRGLLCCSENRRVVRPFFFKSSHPLVARAKFNLSAVRVFRVSRYASCSILQLSTVHYSVPLSVPRLFCRPEGCLALASVCVRAVHPPGLFSLSFFHAHPRREAAADA